MKPLPRRLRAPLGSLLVLAWLVFYIVTAATIGSKLTEAPPWASMLYFAVVGFCWVAPLKPLVRWITRPDALTA